MTVRFERGQLLGPAVPAADRARRARALALAEAAIEAVEPGRATRSAIERLLAAGDALDDATVLAWGKAALPMARAAVGAVSVTGGLVVAPEPGTIPGLEVRVGGHPDPSPDAADTGRAFLRRAESMGEGEVALCLVSGGGSALLELPREGVPLERLVGITRQLRERGAAIGELNAVRRALSQLKGGGLARAIAPARIRNVILSDVAPQPLGVVASGATCPPPADAPAARAVLERHGLWDALEAPLRAIVRATPAWENGLDLRSELAADNGTARRAVCRMDGGIRDRPGHFAGDARALGRRLATEPGDHPWVWGGETTVAVTGEGVGGRNQEVALGALAVGWSRGLLLCVGTDGIDGASDAAGALVDPYAVARAGRLGLDPVAALAANDATPFFDALGTALRCGPTKTNVADFCLYLP